MKIAIPVILGGILILAAMFTIMPIEKVTTIHTSIGVQQTITDTDSDMDVGDEVGVTCTADFVVYGISLDFTNGADGDVYDMNIDPDGSGATFGNIEVKNDVDADPSTDGYADSGAGLPLAADGGGEVNISMDTDAADGNNEALTAKFTLAGGGCSAT